jgi:hypothetical protein
VERAVGKAGQCLRFACQNGAFVIRGCDEPEFAPVPRIDSVMLLDDSYAVLVVHKRGSKEVRLTVREVPLAAAVRTLAERARLPGDDLRAVPQGFWRRQRPIVVVERLRPPAATQPATLASAMVAGRP